MLGEGDVLGDSIVALVAGEVGILSDDVAPDGLVLIVAVAAVLAAGAADCVACFEHAPSASTPSVSAPTARIRFILRVPLYGLIVILNSLTNIYNNLICTPNIASDRCMRCPFSATNGADRIA